MIKEDKGRRMCLMPTCVTRFGKILPFGQKYFLAILKAVF